MRRSNVALRLQTSLLEEARRVAESEEYFQARSSRADIGKAKRILRRAGRGKPAVAGDALS